MSIEAGIRRSAGGTNTTLFFFVPDGEGDWARIELTARGILPAPDEKLCRDAGLAFPALLKLFV